MDHLEAARARRAMGITPRTIGPSATRGGLTPAQKKAAFVRGLKAGGSDSAEPTAQVAPTGPSRTQAEKDKLRAAMRRGIRGEGRE